MHRQAYLTTVHDAYRLVLKLSEVHLEAVANMVKMVGAKPIYCDCAEGSVNPGVQELMEKATPRTKAVIVCHTYGERLRNDEIAGLFS